MEGDSKRSSFDPMPQLLKQYTFQVESASVTADAALVTMAQAFGCKSVKFRKKRPSDTYTDNPKSVLHITFKDSEVMVTRFKKYLEHHGICFQLS